MNLIFGNPGWLALSALALAPLIIHFLYKRKITVLKWPSVIFLAEAQKENSRRLRLREILLLILRMLLILCAVFAVARPVLAPAGRDPASAAGTVADGRSIVLIIDNSLSMGLTDNALTLLEEAVLKAGEILSAVYRPGDAVAVLPSCGAEGMNAYNEVYSVEAARMELDKIPLTFVSGSILDALRTAETFASSPERQVYIFSDFQRSVFSNLRYTPPTGAAAPILVDLSREGRFNAVVESVRLPSVFHGLGPGAGLIASIRNTGDAKGTVTADLFEGDRKTGQNSLVLAPSAAAELFFSWRPGRSGVSIGRVVLDGDQLKGDNIRWFLDHAPERIRILVIDGTGSSGFIRKAFAASEERDFLEVEYAEPSELAEKLTRGRRPDLLILASFRVLPPESASALQEHLRSGRGILIAADRDTDIDEFNRIFVPALLPCRMLSRTLSPASETNAHFSVRQADFSHPLLAYFRETDLFRFARFHGYFKTAPEEADPGLLVLARMNTGSPALIEYAGRHGRAERESGKILFFASSLSDSMNDMPFRPNFPPFLFQIVRYLTDRSFPSFPSGTPVAAALIKINAPDGTVTERLDPEKPAPLRVTDPVLVQPGVYRAGTAWFTVHTPPEESEPARMTEKELQTVFGRYETIRRKDDIASRAREISTGRSLAVWFILLALLCAAGEMLLAYSLQDKKPV